MKAIKYAVLSVVMTTGLSSCNDFFNKLPLNEIVLENFYTEEADIRSVLTSCYAYLQAPDCIIKMAGWGEMRSDNISPNTGLVLDVEQVLKENILPTSGYSKWGSFYTVINYCNTVIYYAPVVKLRDPNYTDTEMRANIAEAKAVRALCYFYLIRAFRDVPLVTQPSIDDTQDFEVPASKFEDVLDFLIQDLEGVKNNAIRRYADDEENVTKFTRYGIYALLADMYLWKNDNASYAKCIEYCDLIIDNKLDLYEEEFSRYGDATDLALYKGIPLISEHASKGSTISGNAYNQIFGTGCSFESIFELNFKQNRSVSNPFIYNASSNPKPYYGAGNYCATEFLGEGVAAGTNQVFKKTDCRYLEGMVLTNTLYNITKYYYSSVSFTPSTTTTEPPVSASTRNNSYINWIIYRLTDIVLMKAEANLFLAKGESTINSESLGRSLSLVSAVYNRANNIADNSTDTLKLSNYGTATSMENLVLLERQRELLFEGKRWFDLLRMARRTNSNEELIAYVTRKQKSNQSVVRIKMKSKDYLYFPYNEAELKANSKLKQNPAYITDKSTVISD